MKQKALIAAMALIAAATLSGCGSSGATQTTIDAKPIAVYDNVVTADSTDVALNSDSASSVATAAANGVFTMDDTTFTNHAAGYRITVPDGLSVIDMGDATYRSTLQNTDASTRLEITTQTLTDDVSAETYVNYANRFLEAAHDFTTTYDHTSTDPASGTTIRTLTWERRTLARVDGDRNYYGALDIVIGDRAYSFLLSSQSPIDAATLQSMLTSFTQFDPTVEAKEYPRQPRQRDDLTEETRNFYETTFADDADLTWGIFPPGINSYSLRSLVELQDEFQHRFDIVLYYANIYEDYDENFAYDLLSRVWENGSVVEFTLQTQLIDPLTEDNMVYDVLDGKYDTYLHNFAADVARFGHPVLFRPFNEMNGDWCNYSAYWTARDASTYVELYRYVYQIFEEEGANNNTLWIWNPNEKDFPNFSWNSADSYYPGDEYVDIVGLTGYNTGNYYEGETWRSFEEIYAPLYAKTAPQYEQPLMITEFACSSIGGDKGDWVEDMFNKLPDYPRIKAAVWWDGADKDELNNIARPYYIDNNRKAVSLFREHLKEDDYQTNPKEYSVILMRPYDVH